MKEDHAIRVRQRNTEASGRFYAAIESGDMASAEKAWRELSRVCEQAISDSIACRIEADTLATELELYRPTRSQMPPAPLVDGYQYVFTSRFPWVCIAVEHMELVSISGLAGVLGYKQEHVMPDRKTMCGKNTTFPVTERFSSGGWPRSQELCPECSRMSPLSKALVEQSENRGLETCGGSSGGRARVANKTRGAGSIPAPCLFDGVT